MMANGWPKPITVLWICPKRNVFPLIGFRGFPQPVGKKRIFAPKKITLVPKAPPLWTLISASKFHFSKAACQCMEWHNPMITHQSLELKPIVTCLLAIRPSTFDFGWTHGHALWFLWIIKVGPPANPFPQQASKVLLDCSALWCLAHTHCMWKTCSVFCLKIQDHGEGLAYNVIHMFCDRIIHFVKEGFNHCWEHFFDVLWNCPGKVSHQSLRW